MHDDYEKCNSSDKRDANEVEAHGHPAHGTAEQEVGGLVGVQQFLISKENKQQQRDNVEGFQQENRPA